MEESVPSVGSCFQANLLAELLTGYSNSLLFLLNLSSVELSSVHFSSVTQLCLTLRLFLAWRIPGKGEPGGLPSMGSHRVGHDWSDSAAAAAAAGYGLEYMLSVG